MHAHFHSWGPFRLHISTIHSVVMLFMRIRFRVAAREVFPPRSKFSLCAIPVVHN